MNEQPPLFTSVTLPAAAVRWRLDVPAGPHADVLVAGLIGAGCMVEAITAGTAYRVDGPALLLQALAAELAPVEGVTLAHESAPVDKIALSSAASPGHPPRRSVTVHGAGTGAAGFIARAVDRGLTVATVGINRWQVAGRTAALLDWLATAWTLPAAEVLQALGLDAAAVVAEDTPAPLVTVSLPPVHVVLPDRRITSDITRNRDGDITQVVQKETNA